MENRLISTNFIKVFMYSFFEMMFWLVFLNIFFNYSRIENSFENIAKANPILHFPFVALIFFIMLFAFIFKNLLLRRFQ